MTSGLLLFFLSGLPLSLDFGLLIGWVDGKSSGLGGFGSKPVASWTERIVISVSRSFSASSPPSSWVSGDMPKPYRRSCRVSRAVLGHSCDQILVGQPLASRAVNEAVEPQQRVPRHIAFVEAESELVNVATEMLRADMMEGAIDAALQNCPNRFDAVGRNAVTNIFASLVIDGLCS
jgi:hypothetical protein